jgi:hypothetical protein
VPDEQLSLEELAEKKRQRFQKNMAEGRARAKQKKVEEHQRREQQREEEEEKYRYTQHHPQRVGQLTGFRILTHSTK